MKIQFHNESGEVVFFPAAPPDPRTDFTIVEVTPEIQAVIDAGGPFLWVGGELTKTEPPPPPVPASITAWQAKAALAMTPNQEAGTMLAAAEAVIDAMPDGPEQTVVRAAWDNNANFSRTSPTILSFAAALGLTDADLDQLFILGDSLTV